jgi:hypothetical protein
MRVGPLKGGLEDVMPLAHGDVAVDVVRLCSAG